MTIPSKSQDKTEEQESASPSHAEDDSLDDTIPPPPPITLPNFTNFRNIYINPITLPSTIPPNKDENGESSPPQPKWDEFCIQWCKQKDLNRDKTIVPECHMLCFRRINAHLKNDLLKKQVVVKEELNHKEHQIENVAQVLYNKTENGGDKTELKVPRNFMDGYYLYYIKGLELCQKHTEGMKNDEMYQLGWTQNNPEESEIDLGEKFEQTKSETKRIIKRAFTPGYQLAKRYVESWKDGTQTSFFKRFYESVQRMDAVHIVQDNIKKAVEVWINDDDDDGGIGRKPNENNGNNRGDGDGNNYNGNGKNSSDERNERDD